MYSVYTFIGTVQSTWAHWLASCGVPPKQLLICFWHSRTENTPFTVSLYHPIEILLQFMIHFHFILQFLSPSCDPVHSSGYLQAASSLSEVVQLVLWWRASPFLLRSWQCQASHESSLLLIRGILCPGKYSAFYVHTLMPAHRHASSSPGTC